MSSFWAKKLGAAPPPVVQNPNLPVGIGQNRPAAVQRYIDRQGGPLAGPLPVEAWEPNTTDPQKVSEVLPIWQWTGNPRGGAGETARTGNCPGCGSPRYFSRQDPQSAKMRSDGQMVYPAPMCMDCGYPNEQGALGVPVSSAGPAAPSRQGATPPPPTGSLAFLRGK